MLLRELFAKKECVFALEVFPPKRESSIQLVYNMLQKLGGVGCDYISVTYSAGGGGAKEYTGQIAEHLKKQMGIEPLAHLTCVNSHRQEVTQQLDQLYQAGIRNILALRGDRDPNQAPVRDFSYASDLTREIQKHGGFYVAAACYPEGHPESRSLGEDIERLRYKLDAGAGHLISQLFFDNHKFYRFLNLARKQGIECPVEAGIMPMVQVEQIERTISLSSASLPSDFTRMVSRWSDDPESFYKAGIEFAIRQCRDLIQSGVDGIHLYAMNKPDVAKQVWDGISDLLPQSQNNREEQE